MSKYDGALVSRVDICDTVGKKLTSATVRVIESPAGDLHAFDWSKVKDDIDILRDLDLNRPVERGAVDLILGVDQPSLLSHTEERISLNGCTAARLTPFGWVAFGATSPSISEGGGMSPTSSHSKRN